MYTEYEMDMNYHGGQDIKQNNDFSSKDTQILILKKINMVLHGSKDFENVIKLEILRWEDCPGLSR
jgi:hypothetical protein